MGFRIENNVLKKYEEEPDVTEIVIPEGVREIGVSAFDRIESVRKIILPQSIEVIQKWAFFECKNLEEINLPKGLLSIGVSAFCCTAIRKIVIPDGAEIGEGAFGRCDLLQDVTIGNGIKSLRESSFWLCPSLKKVKLPETLETIGHSCFADCKNLIDISLPFGLKEIGEKAFSGCGLKKITIPSGTSAIGKRAFARCKMKTAGPIGGGYDYEFGWTTAIPKYAFSGLKKLESVQLSDSISEIGISAFADCKALVKINVRNDMKIEKNAFKGCVSLGSGDHSGTAESASPFTIVNGVLSAYSGQEKTDIVIPDGVITIANRAFYNKLISSVVIPASVASIEKEAFEYSGLSHVTFLGKPKKIGAQAFDMGLSTVRFYDVMKDIAAQISIGTFSHRDNRFQVFIYFLRNFENGAFDSEVAKENWEYIARHMNEFEYNLMENEDLRQIMLAHCVFKEKDIDRLIEKSVENHKIALTAELLEYKNTLYIPRGVKVIGPNTFSGCRNLKMIEAPEHLHKDIDNCYLTIDVQYYNGLDLASSSLSENDMVSDEEGAINKVIIKCKPEDFTAIQKLFEESLARYYMTGACFDTVLFEKVLAEIREDEALCKIYTTDDSLYAEIADGVEAGELLVWKLLNKNSFRNEFGSIACVGEAVLQKFPYVDFSVLYQMQDISESTERVWTEDGKIESEWLEN